MPGDGDALAAASAAALRTWWRGEAGDDDSACVLKTLEDARTRERWIACDCRAGDNVYPLMAPAFLAKHRTYYMTRLWGPGRAPHAETCVFAGEAGPGAEPLGAAAVDKPDGFFKVGDVGPRVFHVRADAAPRAGGAAETSSAPSLLTRQLWRLIEAARLNVMRPLRHTGKSSFRLEFASLRDAAEGVEVADATSLAAVFDTFPDAIENRSIFAKLHAHEAAFGDAPPQAFLCLYARDLNADEVFVGDHEPIRPLGGVELLGDGPPYLVLVVIGRKEKGLRVLKAAAQPILSPTRFFPVRNETDRALVRAVNDWRWTEKRASDRFDITLTRTLFESGDAPAGALVAMRVDAETGEVDERIVQSIKDVDAWTDDD